MANTVPQQKPTPAKPAAPSPKQAQPPKEAAKTAPQQAPPKKVAPPPKRFVPSKAAKEIKPKVGRNVLTCTLYAIVVLLLVAAALLFGLAKTGLFNIPIASSFYKGPEPTRLVEAGVMEPDAFMDQISASISMAVQRGETGPYTVPFSEEDLTAAARGGLADVIREEELIAERPQIVVTPEYIEASGKFITDNVTADMLIQFVPVIEEGELRLDISKAYLGDIPISPDLARSMESLLFTRDFGAWSVNVGNVSLKEVNLKDGQIDLILDETEQ